jgi:hypothetical protein
VNLFNKGGYMKKFIMVIVALIYSFLSVNLLFADAKIYGSFTGYGLYSWNGSAWTQLTYLDPASGMVASGSTLYADFPGYGLYSWSGTAWTQINTNHPASMVASSSALYVKFAGTAGLKKWNGSAWSQLAGANPSHMAVAGSVLYADFAPYGLWKYDGSAWTQLTYLDPASGMVASGSTLYADFPGYGLYSWNGSAWTQLTNLDPASGMVASGLTLYAAFTGHGLYSWNGASWTQINTVRPASMVYGAAGPAPVNLGTAGNFVILAKTGISNTGTTNITGDIGISPAAATYITGFGLIADSTNTFSTSSLVTGKVYASNYAVPTPAKMTAAVSDMETAYTDAAGRTLPDYTELYDGDVTGRTLVPGLYKWGTGVLISDGGVTLSGGANDVWIFQIAGNLTVDSTAIVHLSGGAQAKNIFWQVAGQATLGTTSQFKGIILCKTLIAAQTGATLTGRALAQTAVTLDATAITAP